MRTYFGYEMEFITMHVPVWNTGCSAAEQMEKIAEEFLETRAEFEKYNSLQDSNIEGEAVDLIQATMNLLNIVLYGLSDDDMNYLMDRCFEKNARRGYIPRK